MHKKSLTKILSLLLCFCMLSCFFSACTYTNSSHKHEYNNQVIASEYLEKDATCEDAAKYYFSCSCGKKTTKTFEYGKGLGHSFNTYFSDNNATYDSDGTKTARCSRPFCNKTDTITDSGSKLKQTYTITFYDDENVITSKVAKEGETFSPPTDPVKTNYIFTGWYLTSACETKYDFSKPVTNNFNLYAGYTLDALALTNQITTETMNSIVKVYNKSYTTNRYGVETAQSTSQGSGFCFHIQNGTYYILTNCHVAMKKSGYDNQTLIVEDYKGNRFDATIYNNLNKLGLAISADYDLAVVKFTPTDSIEMQALEISNQNAVIGDVVISLGAPEGQTNSITYGKVTKYGTVTLNDTPLNESNVTFNVAFHTAKINHGSSGGPLLDANLTVVGVNYAGISSTGDGRAIPTEKVLEFLSRYVYN